MGENYLIHYGIPEQKWGHRHGPPYPLNPAKDYSAAEKKAAVKKYKSAKAAYKAKKSEYKMKKQEIKRLKALKAQMKQGPEAMAGAATDSYGNTYTMKVEKGSRAAKNLAKTSYKLTKAQLKNAKAEKKVIKEEKNKLKKELKDAKAQLDAIKESMRKNGASEEEIKSFTRSTEEKIDSAMDKIAHSSHSYSIKFTDDSECLEHYGVKGMKWRRHKTSQQILTDNRKRKLDSAKLNSEMSYGIYKYVRKHSDRFPWENEDEWKKHIGEDNYNKAMSLQDEANKFKSPKRREEAAVALRTWFAFCDKNRSKTEIDSATKALESGIKNLKALDEKDASFTKNTIKEQQFDKTKQSSTFADVAKITKKVETTAKNVKNKAGSTLKTAAGKVSTPKNSKASLKDTAKEKYKEWHTNYTTWNNNHTLGDLHNYIKTNESKRKKYDVRAKHSDSSYAIKFKN